MTLLLLLLSVQMASADCSNLVPKGEQWHFANLILQQDSPAEEKIMQLAESCEAFNSSDNYWNFINELGGSPAWIKAIFTVPLDLRDAFHNLGSDSIESKYKSQLEEIKKIPSAAMRVKKTYELFLKYKQPYDNEDYQAALDGKLASRPIFLTPGEALKNKSVCRDYTRLLLWSLRQVVRSSSNSKEAETFTAKWKAGWHEKDGFGHMWISVNLPIRSEAGRIVGFRRIDLDPTQLGTHYAPLMPLAQKHSKETQKKYFQQCEAIRSCLVDDKKREQRRQAEDMRKDYDQSETTQ